MGGFVNKIFGPSKPEELKEPESTVPTKEDLALEAQKAARAQRRRSRAGYASTILTSPAGGKTLLGE